MSFIQKTAVTLSFLVLASASQSQSVDPSTELNNIIQQLEQEIATFEAEIVTLESRSPAEGSERAAQNDLLRVRESLEALERTAAAQDEQVKQAFAQTSAILKETSKQWTNTSPGSSQPSQGILPSLANLTTATTDQLGTNSEESDVAQSSATETGNTPGDSGRQNASSELQLVSSEPLQEDGLARRVLSLPGALLFQSPDDNRRSIALQTFSILYVFSEQEYNGERWLAVGETSRSPDGWLRSFQAEAWKSMLVMQYAPKGGRDRVVFFHEANKVHDLIEQRGPFRKAAVTDLYNSIKNRAYDPDDVVSIEPELAVNSDDRPYLMPILDFEEGFFDSGEQTQILQLAAVNLGTTQVEDDSAQTIIQGLPEDIDTPIISSTADPSLQTYGIAFVIDTTKSMGPYIDITRNFVRDVKLNAQALGIDDKVDFALIGFRDDVSANSRIDYVTRKYRDFGQGRGFVRLDRDISQLVPSSVSTRQWREDAFAGLVDAIDGLNWNAVTSRIVFLVTDASPRSQGDNAAAYSSFGPQTISAYAERNNVSLKIVHLQTPQAKDVSLRTDKVDDTLRGEQLYSELRGANVGTIENYFRVTGDTVATFERQLQALSSDLSLALQQVSSEQTLVDVGQQGAFVLEEDLVALSENSRGIELNDAKDSKILSSAILSELFRYQQEYLGAKSGTEAPDFYRAWASDLDLRDPRKKVLEVSVFMTRAQLGILAKQLGGIVERLENKETGLGEFFSEVQAEAGKTQLDPNVGVLLPQYLQTLPYGSKFINITSELWDSLSPSDKEDLLNEVKQKVAFYRKINSAEAGWYSIDGRTGGEQVFPLPLVNLP